MRTRLDYVLESLKTAAIVVGLIVCMGCSTGIESTKKIKMSKEDVKLMVKTAEQAYTESLQGSPLSSWKDGKEFLAMSDRTLYIFEPTGLTNNLSGQALKGKTLIFKGTDSYQTPDLREECILLFTDGQQTYRYRTGKPTAIAMKEIESSKLPLMSDLDLISQWKEKLMGQTLWTKSNLWYDEKGDRCSGQKFAKIIISDVVPATGDFPMKVKIKEESGKDAFMQLNYTSDAYDSRNFASLFFLSDPKAKYPKISEDNWTLIKDGKVGLGMTKEECKLAIGNPDEVNAGHTHSQTMDMWQYANGTYLMFTDGLLTRFRQ
ncbi:MAG: hypothetical protein K2K25_09470 [Muribaculaceae bacterium]|nr:hypothetical protein [Muribaculaceae bacterium]